MTNINAKLPKGEFDLKSLTSMMDGEDKLRNRHILVHRLPQHAGKCVVRSVGHSEGTSEPEEFDVDPKAKRARLKLSASQSEEY